MARTYLRVTAAAGALGLGLMAMSPAAAATDFQAGATAFSIKIADQDPQGTGIVTAKYENGTETKTGETEPPFPQPAQNYFQGGVLVQEATAAENGSAACAGLAGDGKGAITIGDSSCLVPGNLLNGSLQDFSFASLIEATTASFPAELKTQLAPLFGGLAPVTTELDKALDQAKAEFGEGGLEVNLEAVEGRCTAIDGGAAGDSTLANARIALNIPGQDPLVLLSLPVNPDPNTELFTDLSDVLDMIVNAVDAQLAEGLQGQLLPLQQLTAEIRKNIIENVRTQLEENLAPLEENLLKVTLNQQEFPTPDSIKVRALRVELLPVVKEQFGNALIDLQIGDAACAPVASAVVSPPQAGTPPVVAPPALPETPTGVSSGLGSASDSPIDRTTWALLALAGLGLVAAAGTGVRRLFD